MSRKSRKSALEAFERLLDIMDDLREKCPWDRVQTNESLSSLTVEEVYELTDAIQKSDDQEMEEELGDILLHMIFYAKIGEEKGAFDIESVLNKVADKLIRRHPHIYGSTMVENEEEVKQNWERIKMAEGKKSIFQGVPPALPPLIKAQRMQEKAAKVGFEWEKRVQVWEKVLEELDELKEAVSEENAEMKTEEFGDVLFALINYARFIDVDANFALDSTNQKFRNRVEYIEASAKRPLHQLSLQDMDALWEKAKELETKEVLNS